MKGRAVLDTYISYIYNFSLYLYFVKSLRHFPSPVARAQRSVASHVPIADRAGKKCTRPTIRAITVCGLPCRRKMHEVLWHTQRGKPVPAKAVPVGPLLPDWLIWMSRSTPAQSRHNSGARKAAVQCQACCHQPLALPSMLEMWSTGGCCQNMVMGGRWPRCLRRIGCKTGRAGHNSTKHDRCAVYGGSLALRTRGASKSSHASEVQQDTPGGARGNWIDPHSRITPWSEDISERMPDRISGDMPEIMSETMPEDMSERLSERMSKDMLEWMSEDCLQSVCEVESIRMHFRSWVVCPPSLDTIRLT